MVAALALVCTAYSEGKIARVTAGKVGSGVELRVTGDQVPEPRSFATAGGRLRVFEFDAGMQGAGSRSTLRHGSVEAYEVVWHSGKPPKVRVNVTLSRSVNPVVRKVSGGWSLAFNPAANARFEPFPQPSGATSQSTAPASVTDASLQDLIAVATTNQVSLDFVNTDIVQILKAISLQSGLNIVTSPDVRGNLTVSLRNLGVEESIQMVAGLAGLAYTKVGATYLVAAPDRLASIRRQITGEPEPRVVVEVEPTVSQTYHVRGGAAGPLRQALTEGFRDGDGKSSLRVTMIATPANSASAQTIVVRGPQSEVDNVIRLLQAIDTIDSAEGAIEIYEVRFSDPRALREDLVAAFPGLRASIPPGPAGNPRLYTPDSVQSQVREEFDPVSRTREGADARSTASGPQGQALRTAEDVRATRDARGLIQPYTDFEGVSVPMKLILRGSPELVQQAIAYAQRLDVQPRQVAIELRVMELSREEATRIGLSWNILDAGGIVRLISVDQGIGAPDDTSGTLGAQFRGGHSVLGRLDQVTNNKNLIARPNLLALDGRETEVFVGDVLKYIKSIERNPITGEPRIEIDEERVGVRLAVLARAGAEGNITMDLRPVVSSLRGFLNVAGGGQIPQISERITQSSTIIRSGETIALGGLIRDEDRRLKGGIPFLKDLPIIGHLFSRTDNVRERTEIVFFLTARIVDETTRQDAARPAGGQ
jgi:type II secretory pathway component GspD/PulD (secretin)